MEPAIEAAIFSDGMDLIFLHASDIFALMTDSDAADKAAIEPGKDTILDRGEPVSLMEPMRISESSRHRAHLYVSAPT